MPINIQLNGENTSFQKNLTIAELIQYLKPESPYVAVELNGEVLDKNDFLKIKIKDMDIVEIIQPLGGGNR